MNNQLTIKKIEVVFKPGTSIQEEIRLTTLLSLKEDCIVTFDHNGVPQSISANDILGTYVEAYRKVLKESAEGEG